MLQRSTASTVYACKGAPHIATCPSESDKAGPPFRCRYFCHSSRLCASYVTHSSSACYVTRMSRSALVLSSAPAPGPFVCALSFLAPLPFVIANVRVSRCDASLTAHVCVCQRHGCGRGSGGLFSCPHADAQRRQGGHLRRARAAPYGGPSSGTCLACPRTRRGSKCQASLTGTSLVDLS